MTDGPFYPPRAWREQWSDWDADLSRVQRDGRTLVARGEHLGLALQLADTQGRIIDGAEVEIWQCDVLAAYRHPGVGPDVPQKLRRGVWSIQAQVDLHGLRTDDAREALGKFIRMAHRQGIRCIRVVHGKGLGSPGKAPVLKDKVRCWLVQKAEVLCFVQAPPMQGGKGALLVLLQPNNAAQRPGLCGQIHGKGSTDSAYRRRIQQSGP